MNTNITTTKSNTVKIIATFFLIIVLLLVLLFITVCIVVIATNEPLVAEKGFKVLEYIIELTSILPMPIKVALQL